MHRLSKVATHLLDKQYQLGPSGERSIALWRWVVRRTPRLYTGGLGFSEGER